VTNASAWSSFRGLFSASAFSVFFRVNPWQMLLLVLPSVAYSAYFREIPCFSVANASAYSSFRGLFCFLPGLIICIYSAIVTL